MRNGHRRTQSDNYYHIQAPCSLDFKLITKQSPSKIFSILKQSTHKNKTKTVNIDSLDEEKSTPQQDSFFFFGRKGCIQTPSTASYQFEQDCLSSIPETKNRLSKKKIMRNSKIEQKSVCANPKGSKMISASGSKSRLSPHLISPVNKVQKKANQNSQEYFLVTKTKVKEKKQKKSKTKSTKQLGLCQKRA